MFVNIKHRIVNYCILFTDFVVSVFYYHTCICIKLYFKHIKHWCQSNECFTTSYIAHSMFLNRCFVWFIILFSF